MLIVSLIFNFLFYAFQKGGPALCAETNLKDRAPFRIGVAINTEKLKYEEKYWQKGVAQFNSFTPEKILKPRFVHPKKDHFDFWEPDHLMEFCRSRSIRLHGHALVWHEALPEWMEEFRGSAAEWDTVLKVHIKTIVNHCKHTIKSWDVVNEAFNDDGTLRQSLWLKNIGESYIEKAFRYAAEADPEAVLFYNDYSLEREGPKLRAVLAMVAALRAKGVKVDGIGMQMHINLFFPEIAAINSAAQRIQAAGLQVHYSELDVNLAGEATFMVGRKKLIARQEQRYREIVEGYMKLDHKYRFGITLWGVSDNDSWLSDEHVRARPLLYDNRYRIKPAYCGFVAGLGAGK